MMQQNRDRNGRPRNTRPYDLNRDVARASAPSQDHTPRSTGSSRYGYNGEPLSRPPSRSANGSVRASRADNSIQCPTQTQSQTRRPAQGSNTTQYPSGSRPKNAKSGGKQRRPANNARSGQNSRKNQNAQNHPNRQHPAGNGQPLRPAQAAPQQSPARREMRKKRKVTRATLRRRRMLRRLTAFAMLLCVIGAGVIGLEFASIFRSFGSEVNVLEYCKDILPRFDTDLAKRLKQALVKRGIGIETGAQVQSIERDGDKLVVTYLKKDKEFRVEADKVLMAVGRRPNTTSAAIDAAGIEYGPRGVVVDADMRTNVPHIFAIGDITGGMMLAHVATFQGKLALKAILEDSGMCSNGDEARIRLDIVPAAVFTKPEAATVGKTEDECKNASIPVKCLKSFFRANGKALSMDEPEGFCKLVVAEGSEAYAPGQILGCHLFGAHSADLIHEVASLMNHNATVAELASTVHAHPTLGEVILDAAHTAL